MQYEEIKKDRADRKYLEELARVLNSLLEIMVNTCILHDYNFYQNSVIASYRYTKYMKEVEQIPKYDSKYQ